MAGAAGTGELAGVLAVHDFQVPDDAVDVLFGPGEAQDAACVAVLVPGLQIGGGEFTGIFAVISALNFERLETA